MNTKEFNEKYKKIYYQYSEDLISYERGMKMYRRNSLAFKNNELGYVRTISQIHLLEDIFRDLNGINRKDS